MTFLGRLQKYRKIHVSTGEESSGFGTDSTQDLHREGDLQGSLPNLLLRVSSRGSTHTTVARGTALSESLVGKPRGKATDPLIHAKGSATLLLQLGRKAHVHAPTRDED